MLTSMGKRHAKPVDAIDLLLECHTRIRTFTAVALRLGQDASLDDAAILDGARSVARYFTLALPLHEQDEEASILPRLKGRSPQLDESLGRMTRDHKVHKPHVQGVILACEGLLATPARAPSLRASLAEHARALLTHWSSHLVEEEIVLFSAVRSALSAGEQAAILLEIRRRREQVSEGGA
jgi:hemerythrin-like domain-containing protein